MAKKVIVIGSGVGGLATAVRLSQRGFEVEVFEANEYFGGKATKLEKDGYFWGFGPSLFTMPHLLDELVTLCGKKPEDYYHYTKLDPVCKYFFGNGKQVETHADKEKFAAEAELVFGEPKHNTLNHLTLIEKRFSMTEKLFLHSSLHKAATYLDKDIFASLGFIPKMGLFTTMDKEHESVFETAEMQQLFNRYATYNGSDPYQCPATMNVTAAPEYSDGGYILSGGMPDLSRTLYQLATENGVKFHFDMAVEKIIVENGKATGVWVNGAKQSADIVVSNMDVWFTYKKLMKDQRAPERILQQPRSTSAIIFYWGMDRTFDNADIHNIFFSANYKEEFEVTFGQKTVYHDPTTYLFVSSKHQPQHATAGGENWFIVLNIPNNEGQDWDKLIAEARIHVQQKLSKHLGVDVAQHIVCEQVNDPRSIEAKTSSYMGSLYGNSSNNLMAAFLRHPNFSREIDNLYFCGGSVHPGGGVPVCLLSAKITDSLIKE